MIKDSKHKRGKTIGFYFAIFTSLLIAGAILVTAFYSVKSIAQMMNDFKTVNANFNNFVATTIVKTFGDDAVHGNYSKTDSVIESLEQNGYIYYAFAYDNISNKIVWASDKSFVGKKQNEIVKNELSKIDEEKHIVERELQAGKYNIIIGLSQAKLQSERYSNMIKNLELFVILFLLLGVIISAVMSKMINKPLTDLVSGVQEFALGDFKHRLKDSGFQEIDKLVYAYNDMAKQLNDLYESLENKVAERTKELEQANLKLKETQTMMVHSEKMRSLGELVAGIAHEINNPINFIYGNIMILDNYQKDLLGLIDKYGEFEDKLTDQNRHEIDDIKKKIDIDFLKDDIKDLIKSCIEGVERTKNIILDLKNFSRMDEMVFSECNLPREIDTTLNILNNKIKNRITVHKDYEENLPKVEAYGGQLNQVFMNILDNSQSAIKDKGDIYITVKKAGDKVSVQFEDTGCGIDPDNLNKIFEPFFTTKPPGQGTGLGMSIAYRVIEAHNGTISVDSKVGVGTKITIVLPINHKHKESEAQ